MNRVSLAAPQLDVRAALRLLLLDLGEHGPHDRGRHDFVRFSWMGSEVNT
jgi:hypothetical protein